MACKIIKSIILLSGGKTAIFRADYQHLSETIGEIITDVIQVTLKLLSLSPAATDFNSKAFNSVAGLLLAYLTIQNNTLKHSNIMI